jgi:ACS family hexuronate transporter-like MFS transporter
VSSNRDTAVDHPGMTTRPLLSGRWVVCALLFGATTINYLDRQVIGLLKPTLQLEFGWNETDYASIVFWFQAAYAAGLLMSGRILDRVGVRAGYGAAVSLWSLAMMGHALARSVAGFSIARGLLGLAEAANFPAAVKAVGEWFPKSERALATGLFNAGANVGVLASIIFVPMLVTAFGWEAAFVVTGALGLLWLIPWWAIYRTPKLAANAVEWDGSGSEPSPSASWSEVLRKRQTWAYAAGKFLTDPIWWFFLFWLPDFFHKTQGLNLLSFGPPLLVIYIAADLGSVGGGGLSSYFIRRGWSVNAARKTAMLLCALCVVPVTFAVQTNDLWTATALIALAAAAHQGWSANLLTLPADSMPGRAVASVVGFGGMMGAIGGMLMAKYAGQVLQSTGSYQGIFVLIGGSYLVALLVIHVLAPRLGEPAN